MEGIGGGGDMGESEGNEIRVYGRDRRRRRLGWEVED